MKQATECTLVLKVKPQCTILSVSSCTTYLLSVRPLFTILAEASVSTFVTFIHLLVIIAYQDGEWSLPHVQPSPVPVHCTQRFHSKRWPPLISEWLICNTLDNSFAAEHVDVNLTPDKRQVMLYQEKALLLLVKVRRSSILVPIWQVQYPES